MSFTLSVRLLVLVAILPWLVASVGLEPEAKPEPVVIPAKESSTFSKTVPCRHEMMELGKGYVKSCLVPENRCSRQVVDGLFSAEDIKNLHNIAMKGMNTRTNHGGPTILDINTGYIRDTMGLENLFVRPNDIYTSEDFSHYGNIIKRLKENVEIKFGISNLHFTAPTFITRLDGSGSWVPRGIHDEYWHSHSDMNNTGHYHYSGLLYMSNYGLDFTGGRLIFENENVHDGTIDIEEIVEPRKGRVVMFTSGPENTHRVEKVTSGQRYVLAFWFTCNPDRQFEIFLDGKQHTTFSHRFRQAEMKKREEQEDQWDLEHGNEDDVQRVKKKRGGRGSLAKDRNKPLETPDLASKLRDREKAKIEL